MRIAVDAMGGDHAPREIVKGAILAAKEYDIHIILVGDKTLIQQELDKAGNYPKEKISVIHAEEAITMDDLPSVAVRKKRKSSVHEGLRLVKKGEARAFFSAGNTGAVMACAKLILRPIEGVDRPAIGAVLPNAKGHSVILDIGANVDCKSIHFLQFAIMGSAYAKIVFQKDEPTVGLLSIGEEDLKGNESTKNAFNLLKTSPLIKFIGNVEGKELYKGGADVVVCDGFAGNIALKVSESAAWYIGKLLKEELTKNFIRKMAALILKPAFESLKKRADYTEYGGAPLLGVNGICIIGHGSSNANAVKNGIKVAYELAEQRLNQLIEERVKASLERLKVDKVETFWNNIKDRFKKITSD
ncbi:fatty acid/phospholipid synthesis protein PlsX [Deferribacter desulfuricans SSM1]|uniref:Phosphate acyltransferase n=1 Tax=Deferribacter desulfuricans (strain DSM 14783 / JCM 11476 / NBRC 101012 / SSM1) TaxID=639282 RepID=D3PAN8_DEFDS|nr:phosphate acyltransferase PlsX [Deferribacter desulfuricans]BAI79661.1 fatty acid/phospholipid synthesis protein PlsX [Deferribacter desulfuricans SSM1]